LARFQSRTRLSKPSRLSLVFAGVFSNASTDMPPHTRFCCVAGFVFASVFGSVPLAAQADSTAFAMASLQEEVRLLSQRVNEQTLRLEQLERANSDLQAKAGQTYVTLAQLNGAIAEAQKSMQAAMRDDRRETLQLVNVQMGKMANETQAAINALAKNAVTRPPVTPPTFNDDYSKDGVSYTVQRGDTISGIAHKTNARAQDIINANKITDPGRLQAGQTLFIPQQNVPQQK
jgi:LysM repeat protein